MRSWITGLYAQLETVPLLLTATLLGCCAGCYKAPPPPPMLQFERDAISEVSQAKISENAEKASPSETTGSEKSEAPENQLVEEENQSIAFDVHEEAAPWITPDRLPWSIDYVQYLNGRQIGFSHIDVLPSMKVSGRINILRTDVIETNLNGQASRAQIKLDALESNTGQLIDLKIESNHLGITNSSEGFLKAENLTINSVASDSTRARKEVPWKQGAWGTLGVQSLLLRQPLITAGERRLARVFIPSLMEIAEVEMIAGEPELTPLVGGVTPELLPIDVVMRTETSGMRSRNWINGYGEIEKTLALTGPSVTTFRVPRAITRRLESAIQMEGWMTRTIELDNRATIDLGAVNELRDRTYLIKSDGQDLNVLRCPRQAVVFQVSGEANVTIRSTLPTPTELSQADAPVRLIADEPTDADRLPNVWLPSENPTISTLAEELLGGAANPGEIASQLTRAVAELVQAQPLDTRFTNVLETARNRTGDCVDRAMLLTTLLRNRQIAARVRSGMRLETSPSAAFHYHMWTEAWIDEQWQSYDPSTGEPITVGHIAMVHTPMGDENPYDAIVPVLEAMQRITSIQVKSQLGF